MTKRAHIKHYRPSALDRQGLGDCSHGSIGTKQDDCNVAVEFVAPNPPLGCSKSFLFDPYERIRG